MSTVTLSQSLTRTGRWRTGPHGRRPAGAVRLLIAAVREGMSTRERYASMRRQGLPHADAINRAFDRA
jgi:hypothetical protein